ncbi:exopolysaccharide production repressor protein [Sinorhizobium sp. BJ1]|uniref:exopolysaccharide production repressor protein n=1 Tax=Sinorhizobium sp. BJ1 TaxID=2035455 RepID=UPI002477FA6A|nr:exopolysaccharide production repressor protein [Sinorhizobium sp. BJ1]
MIPQTKPGGTALSFSIFHRILWLFLCGNTLIVYFVSGSIRSAVVTTMVGSLSLQLAYFGGVLLLVWRAGRARRAVQRTEQCDSHDENGIANRLRRR